MSDVWCEADQFAKKGKDYGLFPCGNCGHKIGHHDEECPHCGRKNSQHYSPLPDEDCY